MIGLSPGATATDVVVQLIAANRDIMAVKLVQYPPMPTFNQVVRATALSMEEELDRRLRHGGKTIAQHTLVRAAATSVELARLVDHLPPEAALAISSEVTLDTGETAHLSLLDFQCVHSPENLSYISAAMRKVDGAGGVILDSVNSYHFYGMSLLKRQDWHRFMGRSLLLEPLVDVRYIGHCLLDGFAALRISPRNNSLRDAPTVVAIL